MKLALVHDTSEKSQIAVVPLVVGVTLVSVAPAAVYALPEVLLISFVALYAVVDAPSVALEVYSAILNVWPLDAVKLCVAVSSSCFSDVQSAEVIATLVLENCD